MAEIKVEVHAEQAKEKIERLLTTDRTMRKYIQAIIRQELSRTRSRVSKDARSIVGNGYPNSSGDPRQAYRAIKHAVYKRILGGNISILQKRKASNQRIKIEHERKEVIDKNGQHRGGNRRKRSNRTEQVDSYFGSDRGFILRFLNAGTNDRDTRYGNRGSLRSKDWFGIVSRFQMQAARETIEEQLDKLIEETVNK